MIRNTNHYNRRGRVADPTPSEIRERCQQILRQRVVTEANRRRHIILRLSRIHQALELKGPMTVFELVNLLGYTRRIVTDHLNEQIEAGQIVRSGRCDTPFYSLSSDKFSSDEAFADLPSADSVLASIHDRAKEH